MTDEQPEVPAEGDGQQPSTPEPTATGWVPHTAAGAAGQEAAASTAASAAEHPELLVGAAFVGGLLAAMILKRFAR